MHGQLTDEGVANMEKSHRVGAGTTRAAGLRRQGLAAVLITVGALVAAGGAATTAGAAPAATARFVEVSNNTSIPCSIFTYATPTNWYFPTRGTPKGVVWLQHGFTESNANWDAYAPQLASAGYVVFAPTLPSVDLFGCTVEYLGNNTAYLGSIAALWAQAATGTGSLEQSFAAAASQAGRGTLAFPHRWAFVGHSVGGEAVTYVAAQILATDPGAFADLKGLVLDDPVASFVGDNLSTALASLGSTTVPLYVLASPPNSCNNSQSGTVLVEQARTNRPFVGSLIVTGTHGDIFGSAVGAAEELVCGTPQPQNTAAVQTLTSAWLADELAGTVTASYYPGGAAYDALVAAGTISTLPT